MKRFSFRYQIVCRNATNFQRSRSFVSYFGFVVSRSCFPFSGLSLSALSFCHHCTQRLWSLNLLYLHFFLCYCKFSSRTPRLLRIRREWCLHIGMRWDPANRESQKSDMYGTSRSQFRATQFLNAEHTRVPEKRSLRNLDFLHHRRSPQQLPYVWKNRKTSPLHVSRTIFEQNAFSISLTRKGTSITRQTDSADMRSLLTAVKPRHPMASVTASIRVSEEMGSANRC